MELTGDRQAGSNNECAVGLEGEWGKCDTSRLAASHWENDPNFALCTRVNGVDAKTFVYLALRDSKPLVVIDYRLACLERGEHLSMLVKLVNLPLVYVAWLLFRTSPEETDLDDARNRQETTEP